jgi:hypothetical protein
MIRALAVLRKADREGAAFFWYDAFQPGGGIFRSICSSRLWLYRLIGEQFPTLEGPGRRPEPGQILALLSYKNDVFAEAADALGALGMTAELRSVHEVESGPVRFRIYFVRTAAIPQGFDD